MNLKRTSAGSASRCSGSRITGRVAVAVLGVLSAAACFLRYSCRGVEWVEPTLKRETVGRRCEKLLQAILVERMYAMHGKTRQQHSSIYSNSEGDLREVRIFTSASRPQASSRTDLSLRPRFEECPALRDRHASARRQVELYEMWARSEHSREEAGCRAREPQEGRQSAWFTTDARIRMLTGDARLGQVQRTQVVTGADRARRVIGDPGRVQDERLDARRFI